jgi:predicted DCC family thiol-disulfide oxidoreductase YuxK
MVQGRVGASGTRWELLYDAECGVCRRLLALLLRWDRDGRLEPVALQSPGAATLLADLTPEQRLDSWHLISPSGERFSAGAAFPPLLRLLPGGALPAAATARFPGLAESAYRLVADHRSALSKLTRHIPTAS